MYLLSIIYKTGISKLKIIEISHNSSTLLAIYPFRFGFIFSQVLK
jgi:hypothetical protein